MREFLQLKENDKMLQVFGEALRIHIAFTLTTFRLVMLAYVVQNKQAFIRLALS